MRKLKVIHLRRESGSPPFLWTALVDGTPISGPAAQEEVERTVAEFGRRAGVKDTTSHEEWAAAGYMICVTGPGGVL